MEDNRMVSFSLGGMAFEYDDNKNQINIKKHGISFKSAARIFFDYDRIEFYDEDHSDDEDRYNTIGDTSAGRISQKAEGVLIGNIDQFIGKVNEILFVVYTERVRIEESGTKTDVTTLPLILAVWLAKWFVVFLHHCSAWFFYLLGSVLLVTAMLSFLLQQSQGMEALQMLIGGFVIFMIPQVVGSVIVLLELAAVMLRQAWYI